MSKYIIDITKKKFKDLPKTLDGEVLLEITSGENGNISGYMTCTVDHIKTLKDKTDEELDKMGWTKYKHIIDSF